MDVIFINFENSKTSNSHRLIRNISDKNKLEDKWQKIFIKS